ncbi:MAG: hypothetical protein ABI207_01840 [Crocinitomicaceae bacterium]
MKKQLRSLTILLVLFGSNLSFAQTIPNMVEFDTAGKMTFNYAVIAEVSHEIQDGTYQGQIEPVSQPLCFVGDIKNVLYNKEVKEDIDTTLYSALEQFPTKLLSFDQFIERIKNEQVVMINEAHNRIKPRAFIYSLLPILKKEGFTHLAMETLAEGFSKDLTSSTGAYTNEPMMGLLYRRAVKLGFKFINYDNSAQNRDSMQAVNLWKGIKDSTGLHKTAVIVGYGHHEEWYNGEGVKPMGIYFKEISGINPLTIDQAQMQESDVSSTHRTFHDFFVDTIPKFIDGANFVIPPINDIYICLPDTKFEHNRSTDILLNGERELKSVQVKDTQTVIIQQYLASEISQPSDFKSRVPTDQTTYIDVEYKAYLAFFPHEKYIIVMRNAKNEIISSEKY